MAQQPHVYNERYEIVRPLARGGMAEVYLARDQLLDRPVALKVLFPELSVDRSFVERFRREAQAAANLSHPNIVSVYDYGEEEGSSFIVMEYVDGQTLTQVIRTEGPLLADRAAAIGADVAAALAFAHRNGVVHRDVKPGNVLIDTSGHVKVTDFGIARAGNAQENLTQTGAVMGTATYFSPEQAEGTSVDARSDVYSLGVVLYEMVTGRPPFIGENPVSIAYKHVREPVPLPTSLNPALPERFEAIVMLALAKDREVRYQSADELRADLLRFTQGRPVAAVGAALTSVVAATTMQPAAMETVVASSPGPTQPRRTGAYVALLFVMLGLLVLLLVLLGKQLGFFGSSSTAPVDVPNVTGQTADQATTTLKNSGLTPQTSFENSDADANTVFDQDPKFGQKVAKGTTVTIKVSKGQAPVGVPNVVGESQQAATDQLQALGFKVSATTATDTTQAAGKVLTQDPRTGATAPKGATVNITVSSGKPKVQVPDEKGKNPDDAGIDLQNAGLVVSKRVSEASGTVPDGQVTRTDPAAGSTVDQGSKVVVYVSSGQPTTTTASTTTTTFFSTTSTTKPTTTTTPP